MSRWKQGLLPVPSVNVSSLPKLTRSLLLWLGAAMLVLGNTGCSAARSESNSHTTVARLQTIIIPVEGMSCMSCAARVKRVLKGIEGVQEVEVSLEHREAMVRLSPEKVTAERLESAIDGLGYKAGKSRVTEPK